MHQENEVTSEELLHVALCPASDIYNVSSEPVHTLCKPQFNVTDIEWAVSESLANRGIHFL